MTKPIAASESMQQKIEFRREGVALIMVLVLIVMISLGAYTFTDWMVAQERATVMAGRRIQAKAAVASGVEYLKDYLTLAPEDQASLGGHWDNPGYFNGIAVTSEDSTTGSIRFSIVSVMQDAYGEPQGWRYGMEDEGAKININTLATSDVFASSSDSEGDSAEGGEEQGGEDEESGGQDAGPDAGGPDEGGGPGGGPDADDQPAAAGRTGLQADTPSGTASTNTGGGGEEGSGDGDEEEVDLRLNVLMQLPNMTETIAESILDWIDADDDPRPTGAEGDMYSMSLNYAPPNGPIQSLDELLLVQGVTPELLFGADRNHNGIIDEDEQAVAQSLGGAEGSMARGWSAYLTVNSKDYVQQSEDPEPIDINGDDLETLHQELLDAGIDQDLATYIVAYRQGGPYTPPEIPEDAPDDFEMPELPVPQSISGLQPSFDNGGDNKFESVLDIIGSSTQAMFAEGDESKEYLVESPYGEDSDLAGILPTMMSLFAIGDTGGEGRLNTNHCTQAALAGLPGMDITVAQDVLLSQDPGGASGDVNYLYPTWPLAMGSVTLEQMKALLPYVSGTGSVFRAQIIGYSDVPGVYARAEVVIDASGDLPTVLSWRDLTHLGAGFSLDTLTSASTTTP